VSVRTRKQSVEGRVPWISGAANNVAGHSTVAMHSGCQKANKRYETVNKHTEPVSRKNNIKARKLSSFLTSYSS